MIKVHKDVLNYLNIEHMFIISETTNSFCIPLEISQNKWIIAIEKELFGEVELNIKYKGKYLSIKVNLENLPHTRTYNIILPKINKKDFKELINQISELEKNQSLWEKRKEERYMIGKLNTTKLDRKSVV